MSSFTISKQEYMKAAGLVSGIAEEAKIWMYDFEMGRNSTPEDYKRRFAECYEMNALSVKEQYHGDEVGAFSGDQNEYKEDFEAYQHLGRQLVYNGGSALSNAVHELSQFFSSAMYQTEYEPYMYKMQMFFDRLIVEMFDHLGHYKTKSWGSLEIEKPDHEYQKLF